MQHFIVIRITSCIDESVVSVEIVLDIRSTISPVQLNEKMLTTIVFYLCIVALCNSKSISDMMLARTHDLVTFVIILC